uniref:Uncharacterized protein n=1 Tax=Arundo donax TaxID=35708 RepID=A0A0A9BYL5_ARUDO
MVEILFLQYCSCSFNSEHSWDDFEIVFGWFEV